MKSKLNLIATLALVALTAGLWSGCRTAELTPDREKAYLTDERAGASRTDVPRYDMGEKPAPAAAKATKPARQMMESSNEVTLKSDLLQLQKRVPAKANLGQTVENEILVTPLANCANVVITDTIPDGGTYVKSEPAAQVSGRKLTWAMDTLDKGGQTSIKVWYTADREGNLYNCVTMTAIPRGCAVTVVGTAKLTISCQLPASANLNAAISKIIEVKNVGSAAATDVVVTDTPAGGLSASGGLTFNVGELAPGQAKQITVPLKATQRGNQVNVASARAANAEEAKTQCAVVVNQPGLALTKQGTKEQFLGRTAKYDLVVSNTGDTDLANVVVTDTAPAATRIVSAEGATVSGNTATWKLANLAKGAKTPLGIVLTSTTPGSHCNVAKVTSADGLTADAQACTLWMGVPALLLETKDDPDPIGVGEAVTYTIRVTNQGTAEDKNIKVVVAFGPEINPVSSSNGTVSGQTVTFTPVPILPAKQAVTYTITAKGAKAGDHRLKVSLTSDLLTEPVVHEESTHVY